MTDLLIDPDCAGGKHGSCVGDPCECDCHTHKPLGIDPGEPDEGPFCECGEHYPCEAIRALPDAPATPEAEPFHLTLRFNAPSGEAAKRAGFIADLCAAEFGTSDPRLTPADGDLRDRYAEALRLHYADEDALYCACGARIEDWDAHLADAVAAVRDTELERLRARVAELETTPVDWDAQRRRADELEAMLERLRAELAEARRVLTALPDPSTVEELREKISEIFGDPNEATVHAFLDFAWSETARIAGNEMAARWQAEDELAELRAAIERLTAGRVRAEHFACRPYRCGDEASGMDGEERCHGCRRVWPCPTIAALDAPTTKENERCTCGETACESVLCDCDATPCPVNHRAEEARAEAERDAAHAAIDDTLRRMHQLRSWAYRDLNEEGLKNVISVITHVLDCLDPDRTRGAALDASSAPESPKEGT